MSLALRDQANFTGSYMNNTDADPESEPPSERQLLECVREIHIAIESMNAIPFDSFARTTKIATTILKDWSRRAVEHHIKSTAKRDMSHTELWLAASEFERRAIDPDNDPPQEPQIK